MVHLEGGTSSHPGQFSAPLPLLFSCDSPAVFPVHSALRSPLSSGLSFCLWSMVVRFFASWVDCFSQCSIGHGGVVRQYRSIVFFGGRGMAHATSAHASTPGAS